LVTGRRMVKWIDSFEACDTPGDDLDSAALRLITAEFGSHLHAYVLTHSELSGKSPELANLSLESLVLICAHHEVKDDFPSREELV
jgi:hypothetical protein